MAYLSGRDFRASRDGPSSLDGEADLDRHLVVKDLSALDMAARFEDFEPADTVDRARSPSDRGLDGVLDAGGRRADELDYFINVVCHELPSLKMVDAPAYASLGEEPTSRKATVGQRRGGACGASGQARFGFEYFMETMNVILPTVAAIPQTARCRSLAFSRLSYYY